MHEEFGRVTDAFGYTFGGTLRWLGGARKPVLLTNELVIGILIEKLAGPIALQ